MNPTIQTQAALKITRRLRRLRTSEALRAMVRETRLSPDMFILPLFVCEGEGVRREVTSMPGVFNLSVDEAVRETAAARADGIRSVLLFGLPDHKDDVGSAAYDSDAPVQSAIRVQVEGDVLCVEHRRLLEIVGIDPIRPDRVRQTEMPVAVDCRIYHFARRIKFLHGL